MLFSKLYLAVAFGAAALAAPLEKVDTKRDGSNVEEVQTNDYEILRYSIGKREEEAKANDYEILRYSIGKREEEAEANDYEILRYSIGKRDAE